MPRVTILFLAANPPATPRQSLDEEAREIEAKIRAAEHRDNFELITKWAVRPDDLLDAFNRHRPHVVHFSGRGNDKSELVLNGSDGQPRPVTKPALAGLFRVLGQGVRVVVLNFGDSLPQATVIAEHVDCVVGMRRAISERAVVYFAAAFYRALAYGQSVDNAFGQGKLSLLLEDTGESETPELMVRAAVDSKSIVLASTSGTHDRVTGSGMGDITPRPEVPVRKQTSGERPHGPSTVSKEKALTDLLVDVFSGDPGGLLQWVRFACGPQIHHELPGSGASLSNLAFEIVMAAHRHGRIDPHMFRILLAERPALSARIREVARLHDIDVEQP
jgi:hypothetical protein